MRSSVRRLLIIGSCLPASLATAAEVEERYFAHDAVHDRHGVIAPWYTGQNGQCDLRVRIAAEAMKRHPWVDTDRAPCVAPEYAFSSAWRITPEGAITVPPINDWADGDRGQMSTRAIAAWVAYYRYAGDPAAIAHIETVGRALLDHCQTDADHPWPKFLISVPVKGKRYAQADPKGYIQLDIVGEAGVALLHAYQLTGNKRFFEAVKHWADVLVEKRSREPGRAPWDRYANPEDVRWCAQASGNVLTGGIVYLLAMFDELIRLGYTGDGNALVEARDAGRAWLRDHLLPNWTANDAWGRNYWDWENPVQSQTTTDWVARYLMTNRDLYPNWKNDVRNILTLFLNHSCVHPGSAGEVYSGAWAFPESLSCCGTSLAWGPMELALDFAWYGHLTDSEWARELARRQQIIATYEFHETGVVEDNIFGGPLIAGDWFKATHPSAIPWVLETMGWMPDVLGASRENHIMRSSAVVSSVTYGDGRVAYSTFDAPTNTVDVLRLAFEPRSVTACDERLSKHDDLRANGYTVKPLPDGDCIVSIRHDGCTDIVVQGDDPQVVLQEEQLNYAGNWSTVEDRNAEGGSFRTSTDASASMSCTFEGNQVRVVAAVQPDGGKADVYLDGVKQLTGIDFWNPKTLQQQIVYYKNGLSDGAHELKIVGNGERNPLSLGGRLFVDAIQSSTAKGENNYGQGGGPRDAQRMIFGYTSRHDYVDTQGHSWRPGTEFVVRTGASTDSVARSWWTHRQAIAITNTTDPDLYQYGIHGDELIINITVGPGSYDVHLHFAETQHTEVGQRLMTVTINGDTIAEKLDVIESAVHVNRAFVLTVPEVKPKNGLIEVRLIGGNINGQHSEAMIQALEVLPSEATSNQPQD